MNTKSIRRFKSARKKNIVIFKLLISHIFWIFQVMGGESGDILADKIVKTFSLIMYFWTFSTKTIFYFTHQESINWTKNLLSCASGWKQKCLIFNAFYWLFFLVSDHITIRNSRQVKNSELVLSESSCVRPDFLLKNMSGP